MKNLTAERKILWGVGLVNALFLIIFIILMYPTSETADPFKGKENAIVFEGEVLPFSVQVDGETVLLPYKFVKEKIEPTAYIDEASSSIIMTTPSKVVQFKNKELKAFVNESSFELSAAVQKNDTGWVIPTDVIEEFYPYEFAYSEKTKVVTMIEKGKPIRKAEVVSIFKKKGIPIRKTASRKSPIYSYVDVKETVRVIKEEKNWHLVQKENGEFGYIDGKYLSQEWEEKKKWVTEEGPVKAENPLEGKKINMVWEAVYQNDIDVKKIPKMAGVNVVSPTWFELKNQNGDIRSKADAKYVKWAHKNKMQVWGLFSNAFDPDLTHEVLKDYNKRRHVIKQIVTYAETYELDGINIDFENVYLKDKEALVQFVRELTPYLHKQGLVVSLDVTIHSTSEMWSMFYDRKTLAEIVDYIAVMTYDEHPAASEVAGSVASLPWVESGLKGLLEEVPADKLLLGIPFYTRVWTETENGLRSDTLAMNDTSAFLKKHGIKSKWDEVTQQNYATYYDEEKDSIRKVWLEDEQSLMKRLELVEDYNLAGIASWQRGFADNKLWKKLDQKLQNAPK